MVGSRNSIVIIRFIVMIVIIILYVIIILFFLIVFVFVFVIIHIRQGSYSEGKAEGGGEDGRSRGRYNLLSVIQEGFHRVPLTTQSGTDISQIIYTKRFIGKRKPSNIKNFESSISAPSISGAKAGQVSSALVLP